MSGARSESGSEQGASLAGRTIVLIGASRGIGAACARACARAGAGEVVLLARTRASLEAVAEDIEVTGARAVVRPCDVTDLDELRRTIRELDRVDVLVNSAGVNQPEPFLSVEPETLSYLWRVNVAGTFFAAQAAAERMQASGRGGVIVNISSQMGHVGSPMRTAYCTTKHAVEGFTRAAALALAPYGIRVLSVAPTFARTEMTRAWLDQPGFQAEVLDRIPLGRLVECEEVAHAVVFAASDAARMCTGASLVLDGGWTAQ